MPAIQSGKVLVTGANGYIAVWILQKLLDKGFTVRGTVRSEKSLPYLKQLFAKYGDKLEFVIVADITKVPISPPCIMSLVLMVFSRRTVPLTKRSRT